MCGTLDDFSAPLKEWSWARTTLWSKSYVSVIKKTLDLVLIFNVDNQKRKKLKTIVRYTCFYFHMKGIQCKAFLWLFVVSISQNVFFDSFANKRWIVRPDGKWQGFEALSHEKLRSNALLNCFIFVEVCF